MNSLLVLVIIVTVTFSETAPSVSLNSTPRGRDPAFQDASDNSRAAFVRNPTSCRYDDARTGTCMMESECTAEGGTSTKNVECQRGACCLFERTCDGEIRHNNTYFVNPEDTTKEQMCYPGVKVGLETCFLRLDFEVFELGNATGLFCNSDSLDASTLRKHGGICGSNNGSHIYINTKRYIPSIGVSLSESTTRREWRIKVTYIECNKTWTPNDPECRQYYEGVSGTIRSFNYRESDPQQSIMSADSYDICIRREANMCYIKWTSDFFSVGDSLVLINAATNLTNGISFKTQSLFSGDKFGWKSESTSPSVVYSASTPFRLRVYDDDDIRSTGKGFSLRYTQLPCAEENSQEVRRQNFTQIVENIKLAEGLKDSEGYLPTAD